MLYRRLLMNQTKFDSTNYFTLSVTDVPRTDYGFKIKWAGNKTENTLEYCVNGGSWINGGNNFELSIYKGQAVSFRGNCTPVLVDDKISFGQVGAALDPTGESYSLNKGIGLFTFSPEYAATSTGTKNTLNISGNIMSLLYGNKSDYIKNINSYTTLYGYDFLDFFLPENVYDDASANGVHWMNTYVTMHDLIMPASTVKRYSYAWMFSHMFAMTVSNYYTLSSPPRLPATTLAEGCYMGMFGYFNLLSAPELLATYVPAGAYAMMFNCCSSLNYIKMTATSADMTYGEGSFLGPFYSWLSNVGETGTFVKSSSMTLPSGENGIPTGWTVQNV